MSRVTKSIVSVSVVALIVLSTIGVSYSYFTSNLSGGASASTIQSSNGKMNLAFSGDNTIEFSNDVSEYVKEFTITGTNNEVDMGYKISLVIEENTFADNELSYSFVSHNPSNNGKVPTNIANVLINKNDKSINLGEGYFNGANEIIHKFEFTIYLLDFDNGAKNFKGYIAIEENR